MSLRCMADGCHKIVDQCRCPDREKRPWKADYWAGSDGAKVRKQAATRRLRLEPKTRQQAETWYQSLLFNARENNVAGLPPDRHVLNDAIRALLTHRESKVRTGDVRPATLSNHVGICTNYLAPFAGSRPVSAITAADVQKLCTQLREGLPAAVLKARLASFEKELRRSGFARRGEEAVKARIAQERQRILSRRLSARTVRMIADTLALVLDQAVLAGWVRENAARVVPRDIKGGGEKRFALTSGEMLSIETRTRTAAAEERLPIMLMGWCGLRRGEVFGLQRRDMNRATGELRIRRILDREGKEGPVKAESAGDVPVPPWLFAELEAHVASRKVATLDGSEWLFTTRDGDPIHNNQTRCWEKVVRPALVAAASPDRAAQLGRATFHHLRHTFATLLFEGRTDATAQQALLRHASLQMSAHYTHPSAAAKRAAVATLPVPNRCETAAPGRVQ